MYVISPYELCLRIPMPFLISFHCRWIHEYIKIVVYKFVLETKSFRFLNLSLLSLSNITIKWGKREIFIFRFISFPHYLFLFLFKSFDPPYRKTIFNYTLLTTRHLTYFQINVLYIIFVNIFFQGRELLVNGQNAFKK